MIREILLLHHSHTDIGYTNYQANVFALQRDYIRRAMILAERYAAGQPGEQFKWTCETTIIVADFLKHATTREIERLQALHQQGLIGFGGMYCNVSPLYSTDMLARTLSVVGQLRRDYGFDIRYALNCDVNGQSWGLVDMLIDAGFDGLTMAINRAMAPDPQPRPIGFHWESPSGRKLLTWHGEHYGDGNNIGIPRVPLPTAGKRIWHYDIDQARQPIADYIQSLEDNQYPYDFAFLQIITSFMWDNDGPDEALVRFVRDWNHRGWQPRMRIVTLEDLFARLHNLPADELETRSGNWDDWWAQGANSAAFETALIRQTQTQYTAVQHLSALLQGLPQPLDYSADLDAAAWQNIALYDEHTYGASESISHADSVQSRGQWYRKAVYAYDALSAVTQLAQQSGHNLAARLDQSEQLRAIIFNPLPWSRRYPLYLPRVNESGWEPDRLERDLEIGSIQGATTRTVDYGVLDLPAGGYATIPLHLSQAQPAPGGVQTPEFVPRPSDGVTTQTTVRNHGWTLTNRYYHVTVDTVSGAIRSLKTTADDYEWVDATTPWRLGQYVYEYLSTPNGRTDIQLPAPPEDYDYRPHLAPIHQGPTRVIRREFVPGNGQARLMLQLAAPGVHDLRVQIVLYDDLPWIDLIYDLEKIAVAEPESVYIAFPITLAAPSIHYDVAGAIVQAEDQQLINACRDFYAVQQWVDLSNADRGLTVATPDAPLVHLGGFTNHKHQSQLQLEQPYLVGWPMNNHWWTNFVQKQSGWTRFRYRLLPHVGPFDPVAASQFGAEATVDPLVLPVKDRPPGFSQRTTDVPVHLPESHSFYDLTPASVQIVGFKVADDGNGVVIRLQEISGQSATYTLRLHDLASAQVAAVTLLEEPTIATEVAVADNVITGHLEPHQFQTMRVVFTGG